MELDNKGLIRHFSTFKPGDKVFCFQKGEILLMVCSHCHSIRLIRQSNNYWCILEQAINPILSGFTSLTGWTNQRKYGIWSKAVVCLFFRIFFYLTELILGRSPIGNTVGGGWPSNSPHMDAFYFIITY